MSESIKMSDIIISVLRRSLEAKMHIKFVGYFFFFFVHLEASGFVYDVP